MIQLVFTSLFPLVLRIAIAIFLYGRKNKAKNERFHLDYEPLSSDLLNGNCSWKVWRVLLFLLIIANTKPPQQKRDLYYHTLRGDFLSIMTSPCLFPLSSSAEDVTYFPKL